MSEIIISVHNEEDFASAVAMNTNYSRVEGR